ncbi:hypothetical protein SDC9_195295 [bioreactor metagenome]|uniref:Multidrug transporter n=1 Tax=bioreactor metagenome TaxID=1076179 RepID=A0A645I8P1_9ZZZZ
MKTKLLTLVCAVSILGASTPSARAIEDYSSAAMVADAIVVRPVCLAATVVGSAFFVVALPFSAMSKSVKRTGQVLVAKPARATFTRPLGDMQALHE